MRTMSVPHHYKSKDAPDSKPHNSTGIVWMQLQMMEAETKSLETETEKLEMEKEKIKLEMQMLRAKKSNLDREMRFQQHQKMPGPKCRFQRRYLTAPELHRLFVNSPDPRPFVNSPILTPKPFKGNKLCQRCLNHGKEVKYKNHKSECNFKNCRCFDCQMMDRRRELSNRLRQLETSNEGQTAEGKPKATKAERIPNCQRCAQHNQQHRLKDHKRDCPFKDCKCEKCAVVLDRRKLMADQIKLRRQQKKKKKKEESVKYPLALYQPPSLVELFRLVQQDQPDTPPASSKPASAFNMGSRPRSETQL